MPPKGYISISLPREMIAEVRRQITEDPSHGYSSVSEFVKDAVRSHLDRFRTTDTERSIPTDISIQILQRPRVREVIASELKGILRNASKGEN